MRPLIARRFLLWAMLAALPLTWALVVAFKWLCRAGAWLVDLALECFEEPLP